MARINTNVGAVTAQRNLNQSYGKLNSTLERLSTGLRINHGKDDPAGLIVSEQLRSEISAANQAIQNSQRATNIIATSEGALEEIANLLNTMKAKIVEAANSGAMSPDEIQANQLQLDSAVASITRIANTTAFAGRNLLDGSLGYVTSGVDTSMIGALQIYGAQFGTRDYIPVDVQVTQSAQPATLLVTNVPLSQNVTVEVQGALGTTTLSFSAGTSAGGIAAAINSVKDATGVEATASATGVRVTSSALGSRQFIAIQPLPGGGTFPVTNDVGATVIRDEGRDATANINGAQCLGDGNKLTLKTATLDMELELNQSIGLGSTDFAITSGGALFQLGPRVNSNLQISVGVPSMAASRLGNTVIGFLSQIVTGQQYSLVNGQAAQASQIVDEAIRQVSVTRGRLGAFESDTLDTNQAQLSITVENLTSSESSIRDADFAYETSQLAKNQVLVQSGTQVLGLANQIPKTVLQLLGG